jgi:hypothetical protein
MNLEDPLFGGIGAWIGTARLRGLTVAGLLLAAFLNHGTDVHRRVGADHDVISARTERVSRLDGHHAIASIADDVHTTHDAPANQITVVELVFGGDVMIEPGQIFIRK